MADWQDIATAPKDRTTIDVWLKVNASPRSMGWADAFRVVDVMWEEYGSDGPGWYHIDSGKWKQLYEPYITHWMPLPEPPQ
jgi:hypothetical protein